VTAGDDRRFEDLQREVSALRKLFEVTRTELAELRESEPPSTPVGLAEAARIAGVSQDTLYRNAERYGGWKVNPELPKSQWRSTRSAFGRRGGRRLPPPFLPLDRAGADVPPSSCFQ
jgi:hypothetical protein